MANRTVFISEIKSNPFQSRKTSDPGAVDRLAQEIKAIGYWGGALRVRERNSHYELIAGHQRLRALKQIGTKTVAIEVAELSDLEMAEQSLIENLQRHNLLELDKAEAIARAFSMEKAAGGGSDQVVVRRLAMLLGYQNERTLIDFLGMARLGDDAKKVVREVNMPRGAVQQARSIGGEAMVKHAAKHRISELTLKPIGKIVRALPETMRAKVAAAIVAKDLTTPAEVEKIARREQAKTANLEHVDPDLMVFMQKWTADLWVWTKRLKAAAKFKAYIHAHPEIATKFKDAAEEFMGALKDILDL